MKREPFQNLHYKYIFQKLIAYFVDFLGSTVQTSNK